MRADLETEHRRISPHQLVNTIRRDRIHEPSGAVVAGRPEQRTIFIGAVTGGIEVVMDERVGAGMQRQIPCLAALAGDLQMRHAFARVSGILHLQFAQFLAAQRMKKQRGQNGAVALALDRVGRGRGQQRAGLVVADRRRLAFAAFRPRPLNTFDPIMGGGVFLAQIF
jgi:hypothetical protein